jgi:hypothetical protein
MVERDLNKAIHIKWFSYFFSVDPNMGIGILSMFEALFLFYLAIHFRISNILMNLWSRSFEESDSAHLPRPVLHVSLQILFSVHALLNKEDNCIVLRPVLIRCVAYSITNFFNIIKHKN